MARTTDAKVRAALETDEDISTGGAIAAATALVDYVDSQDTGGVLTTAMLLQIETYLAAHFYAIRDRQYAEKWTDDAKAKYDGQTGKGLEATLWGQQAMVLDVTGTLASVHQQMLKGKKKVGIVWLGKESADQDNYPWSL